MELTSSGARSQVQEQEHVLGVGNIGVQKDICARDDIV
jgi:hypothetical protein